MTTEWRPNPRQRALIARMAAHPYPRITVAARDLSISPGTARNWMLDARFKAALDAALADSTETERALFERRFHGLADASFAVLEDVLKGEAGVYPKIRVANMVANRILGMPRASVEHSGPDGQPIAHEHRLDLSGLSDEDLDILERILSKPGGSES